MNPRERILKTMKGQKADRVPLVLPGFQCKSHEELKKMGDSYRKTIAKRIIDETGFRIGIPSHINRMLVTPNQRISHQREELPSGNRRNLGKIDTPLGELTFITEWDPKSRTGWQVKYPVETYDDIKKIASVPWEIPNGLKPPVMDSLSEEFNQRGIMETRISSPFVCVSAMMSYEWFLELCYLDMPLVKELTEICRQRVLDCVKVMLSEPGIEYVWMGGSEWVTPPMAPTDVYDALVQEQEKSIIDYIHNNSDAVVHIHCHGRVKDALPRMIQRGGDYTEPVEPPPDGDITMAEAKEVSKGKITLGGNIECRVLCNESEKEVEQAVRDAFDGGKERFVLRPTEGPSPLISEQEFKNYMRVVDLWEELSPIGD
ncbi:hypothetical protein GF312_12065 [Candidatus Poribacteria bacterium]|nr:hypothetical protein [Candidatus Poribacteria bacterium]